MGWDAHLVAVRERVELARLGDVMVTVAYQSEAPDAAQRRAVAKVLEVGAHRNALSRHAFVTDSSLAFGVHTAVSWLVSRPWPDLVFRDPHVALEWLGESPDFSARALRQSMAEVVPSSRRWPAFFSATPDASAGREAQP